MTLLNGTMTPIETVTVGAGGTANITFSNIPQTYTDLIIVTSLRATGSYTATSTYMRFNNSTSDRSFKFTTGNGSSIENYGDNLLWAGYETGSTGTNNSFANNYIYITNYAGSNYKSISVDAGYSNNSQTSHIGMAAGLWANSAAITSIQISPYTGSWAQYSTATLYGVATASVGAKATGGAISSDTNYWYHTFTFSGTFTPTQSLSCDYLVVAGGGGGGGNQAGGGGGGGFKNGSSFSVTAQNYSITVGAGGAGTNNGTGTTGSNSVFSSITANGGGGGGGGANSSNGANGGSGGGGSGGNGSGGGSGGTANGGSGGNNGGTGSAYRGGGGGGAGASGANAPSGGLGSNSQAGAGGNGTASSITGSSVTYAGGGAGQVYAQSGATISAASGGSGGGGNGGVFQEGSFNQNTAPTAGTANLGGGGGAAQGTGAAGGSGIVIIRYPK